MAKLDDEQVQQFRTLIREEVAAQLDQKLQPMSEKLDQIRTTQLNDANALAGDQVKLSHTVDNHERRIKKLEQVRA